MKRSAVFLFLLFIIASGISSCKKEEKVDDSGNQPSTGDTSFHTTPYLLKLPMNWSMPPIPSDNQLTVEGVALGRKLFYDPMLSADLSQSCSSCHNQQYGFTDNGKRFSTGIDNIEGTRQAMPIFNLAWVERFAPFVNGRPVRFFWDGGAANLESQVLGPITNPIEMHDSLPHVLQKLQADPVYPGMFKKAFGSSAITSAMLMKAIAQFERTIVSYETTYDKFLVNFTPAGIIWHDTSVFTEAEKRGLNVFLNQDKGDCFHCHPLSESTPFLTDFLFHNNGHNNSDAGLKRITGNADDEGRFRTASLRNLVFTAPYMHDGRFNTLEEVVEFYNSQASRVYPADPFITKHPNGLQLTDQDKADLVAFMKTLTDSSFLKVSEYGKP